MLKAPQISLYNLKSAFQRNMSDKSVKEYGTPLLSLCQVDDYRPESGPALITSGSTEGRGWGGIPSNQSGKY